LFLKVNFMANHNFALELPLDNSIEASISKIILRTLYQIELNNKKHRNLFLFPTTNVNFEGEVQDEHFGIWVMHQRINGRDNYNRSIPSFKICKLENSFSSVSYNPTNLSFYELDSPTSCELHSARINKTYFPSEFSKLIFNQKDGINCNSLSIPFDSFVFSAEEPRQKDDLIVFSIQSEFQAKRHISKTIAAWSEKYGNNPRYVLQCAINNKVLTYNQNKQLIDQITKNCKSPSNVKFYNINHTSDWNRFLNNADILINMSGGEAFNYYEFNGVAIGKHAIVLDAHCNKDWATDDNCVLVTPSKKAFVYDGLFYVEHNYINQGTVFDFEIDDFLNACEKAINRVEKNNFNENGLALQTKFNKESFIENIFEIINK